LGLFVCAFAFEMYEDDDIAFRFFHAGAEYVLGGIPRGDDTGFVSRGLYG
jgi:hypothetical protein